MTNVEAKQDGSTGKDVAASLEDFFTGTQSRFTQLRFLLEIGAPVDSTAMLRFQREMVKGLEVASELIGGLGGVAVLMQNETSGTTVRFPVDQILGYGDDGSVKFLSLGPQGHPLEIGWGDNCELALTGE